MTFLGMRHLCHSKKWCVSPKFGSQSDHCKYSGIWRIFNMILTQILGMVEYAKTTELYQKRPGLPRAPPSRRERATYSKGRALASSIADTTASGPRNQVTVLQCAKQGRLERARAPERYFRFGSYVYSLWFTEPF